MGAAYRSTSRAATCDKQHQQQQRSINKRGGVFCFKEEYVPHCIE